jgi:hypothetical protein
MNNGVDVSDRTRYFSKDEWKKLDNDVRKKILDDPERQKLKKQKAERHVNEVDSSNRNPGDNASVISKESEERMVAAIIRGVMQSSQEDANPSGRSVQQVAMGPRHGGRLISGGQSTSSIQSGVTFDRSINGGTRQG